MSGFERKGAGSALRTLIAAATACVAVSSAYAQQAPNPDAVKSMDSQVSPPVAPPTQPDERAGSLLSFSGGVDFSSHFISFGADVWGGGSTFLPFTAKSTSFAYGTVTAKITDELSAYINLWSDLNDNVDSAIGGPIQEIDVNVGVNYTFENFTVGVAYAYWLFGGGAEHALEGKVAYADKGLWEETPLKGFAFNPSLLVHWRYDVSGDLVAENAAVIQAGVNPAWTFMEDSDYPLTVSVPVNVGYFTDAYQGGDGAGFGYINGGVAVSVPLAFIPKGYGNWSASLSEVYYHTFNNDIPNNANDNFFVTTLSLGVSF